MAAKGQFGIPNTGGFGAACRPSGAASLRLQDNESAPVITYGKSLPARSPRFDTPRGRWPALVETRPGAVKHLNMQVPDPSKFPAPPGWRAAS